MIVAILSDTHDNIWKLDNCLPYLADAEAVIHCGDLCSPFIIRRIGSAVGEVPVHIVWGNNDGDKVMISKIAGEYPSIRLHGDLAELDLEGKKVAVNHYPEIGRRLAQSGVYDLVCYGHDHTPHQEEVGSTLLLNPGEVMGMNGPSQMLTLDTNSMAVRTIEV